MKYLATIKAIPFPGISNAFVVISFIDTQDPNTGNGVITRLSFFVRHPDQEVLEGVEWEPEYGPITRIHGRPEVTADCPKHWFFPAYTGNGDWSQLGVYSSGLPDMLKSGDYEGLFATLTSWIDRPTILSKVMNIIKEHCNDRI